MPDQDALLEQITAVRSQLNELVKQHYNQTELFSPRWWILVGLAVIPLILWALKVDKKRLLEISFFGLVVNNLATIMDVLFTDHMMWEYPVTLFPQSAILMPVDYVVVPVVGMTIYQNAPKWGPFLLVSTAVSALMSFVCEPFAEKIGIYIMLGWKPWHSFLIYIAMYALVKAFTQWMVKITREAK